MRKYSIKKRRKYAEENMKQYEKKLEYEISTNRLTLRERIVAEWIERLTYFGKRWSGIVRKDWNSLREVFPSDSPSYGPKLLKINYREIIRQVLVNEKHLFLNPDSVLSTIFSLFHKHIVDLDIKVEQSYVVNEVSPEYGSSDRTWEYAQPEIFVYMIKKYY